MKSLWVIRFFSGLFFLIIFIVFFFLFKYGFNLIEKIQIIPLIFFVKTSVAGILIIFFLFFMTLLFGRVYCSFLCPLGIIQNLIWNLKKFFLFNIPHLDIKIEKIFHLTFAFILFVFALIGYASFIGIFDPFSIFTRFLSVFSFKVDGRNTVPYIFAILFFSFIVISVLFSGRWFCNTLCPPGAILRIISRFSIFKLTITENCSSCRLCAPLCPAFCIDIKNSKIDFERCLMCFECVNACKSNAFAIKRISKSSFSKTRRDFLLSGFSFFILSLIMKKSLNLKEPVMPPGALNRRRFHSLCISCHNCISVCPTGVILPSIKEYGLKGFLQPYLDFSISFCEYECSRCTKVCPTGALIPLDKKKKVITAIGKANLNKEYCIVYSKRKDCGACAEQCPTQAVHMIEWEGLFAPELDIELCIGCGACERVCPSVLAGNKSKAIIVEGLVQQKELKLNN